MKAVALIRLRRLDDARGVLDDRARIDPDGYATHANLGTLFTFTGDLDRALVEVDRALAIDPRAHFGRERYHRQLVVWLRELGRDRDAALAHDFLGLALTDEQRFSGNERAFADARQDPQAFDALIAMIAVYGADDVPHVHYALGDLLALRGLRRLAWAAYANAVRHRHPRAREIRRWQDRLAAAIRAEQPHPGIEGEDNYQGVDILFQRERMEARRLRSYATWERAAVRRGLPVWSAAGLDAVYAEQRRVRPRCPVVVAGELAPVLVPPTSATASGIPRPAPAPPSEAAALVAWLERAAEAHGDTCAARAAALGELARAAGPRPAATEATMRTIDRTPALRARLRAALEHVLDRAMPCRTDRAFGVARDALLASSR